MIMITVDDWDYTLTVGKTNRNRFGSLEIAKSREPEQDMGKAPPEQGITRFGGAKMSEAPGNITKHTPRGRRRMRKQSADLANSRQTQELARPPRRDHARTPKARKKENTHKREDQRQRKNLRALALRTRVFFTRLHASPNAN